MGWGSIIILPDVSTRCIYQMYQIYCTSGHLVRCPDVLHLEPQNETSGRCIDTSGKFDISGTSGTWTNIWKPLCAPNIGGEGAGSTQLGESCSKPTLLRVVGGCRWGGGRSEFYQMYQMYQMYLPDVICRCHLPDAPDALCIWCIWQMTFIWNKMSTRWTDALD